jgi:hypothetical protein
MSASEKAQALVETWRIDGVDCVDGLDVVRTMARCVASTMCARCFGEATGHPVSNGDLLGPGFAAALRFVSASPTLDEALELVVAEPRATLAEQDSPDGAVRAGAPLTAGAVDPDELQRILGGPATVVALAARLRDAGLEGTTSMVLARLSALSAVGIVEANDGPWPVGARLLSSEFAATNERLIALERRPAVARAITVGVSELTRLRARPPVA